MRRSSVRSVTMAMLGSVAAAGCGLALRVVPLASASTPRAPRAASAVDLFVTGRPTVAARDLAILTVEEESIYAVSSDGEALARLREEAGRMGCDALVVLGPSGGVGSGIGGDYTRSLHGFRGACVEYVADAGAPRAIESAR